ncbi:MAG: dihydroorotate dehydrogenase-like protein [Ardenticatenia bacterium]|nr:dihydroorotate dehydrogenase-like protein [Ardenticatenia bacterium]
MDLSTTYLGLSLEHPVMPSASPLTEKLDGIKRLADAGAPAIVMHSLFEEQINHESHTLDHFLTYGSESFAEALSYFPDLGSYRTGPEEYVELIRRAKESVDVPIIASLNGVSDGGWVEYARIIEEAGADALELNIYYIPTRLEMTGAEVEQMYVDVVCHVRHTVSIPVAVKVAPFFSAFANMAKRLHEAGADALVLFNRFYQPDFDLEALDVVPKLHLSTSAELLLPLQWVAILYGRVPVDLALTGGVHTHQDALKGLMAGANVVMMTAELLQRGVRRIREIVDHMKQWMEDHEYESVAQMQGSMSQQHVANPDAFERANYMKTLRSWRPDPTGIWAE